MTAKPRSKIVEFSLAVAVAASMAVATDARAQSQRTPLSDAASSAADVETQASSGGGKIVQKQVSMSCGATFCSKKIYDVKKGDTLVVKYFSCGISPAQGYYFGLSLDKATTAIVPQAAGGFSIGSQLTNFVVTGPDKLEIYAYSAVAITNGTCMMSGDLR